MAIEEVLCGTLGGASLSGRTQDGGFGLGPGPSEVGSEFWRMTAPRALGVAVGVGTAAGSGSWEAGKAARFRVGWSCRDWDRGTGAAYGFSGTRCATRLLCGPSWGSTGLCIGGVWERGPGGLGEAWEMGGSGPALLGFAFAKGEFCCLFIRALSSTSRAHAGLSAGLMPRP